MKKSVVLIMLLYGLSLRSQINLVFSLPSLNRNYEALSMTHLSNSGDKYYRFDIASFTLIIYNLNFSVYKTINIPSSIAAPKIYALSEDLFDTNSSTIEYLVVDVTTSGGYVKPRVVILNEFGNILFQRDSCTINSTGSTLNDWHNNNAFIVKDATGVKMILTKVNPSPSIYGEQYVYALPGQLTCQECIGGIATLVMNPTSSQSTEISLKIFPNPSDESTNIEYSLPPGQTKAELIIYSNDGKEIKRLNVDDFMSKIVLKNSEFAYGSYLLKLITKDG
ncbi:MAG: T9SS type A sorting domain-containing protein, partial [Bacteroidia bacterium]